MTDNDFRGVPSLHLAIAELLKEEGLDARLERSGTGYFILVKSQPRPGKNVAVVLTGEDAAHPNDLATGRAGFTVAMTFIVRTEKLCDPDYLKTIVKAIRS